MKTLAAALLCSTVALLASPAASAATVVQEDNINAPGLCEAAFSNQVVRNRPTGVRNQGTVPIYVTCSTTGNYPADTQYVWIKVANFGTASATVGCNLQPGWTNDTTNTTAQGAFPGSAVLAPNTSNWIYYDAANYPAIVADGGFLNISFTCLLPVNTEIQYTGRLYDHEIGT